MVGNFPSVEVDSPEVLEVTQSKDSRAERVFSQWVERTPDALAIRCESREWTYREVDTWAGEIADRLVTTGVRPGDFVAMELERSPELIATLLAVLRCGAAYVPLDPGHPEERKKEMVATVGARILVNAGGVEKLENSGGDVAKADSICCVMFTSGSTGRPKAVAVPHRAVLRLVRGADFTRMDESRAWLVFSPAAFDASTLEMWAPLANGGVAVVAPAGALSLAELGRTIREGRVTSAWLTAGLFRAMVDERIEDLAPLEELLTGGDVVPVAQARAVLERFPELSLVNGYGPTENTTFSCCHRVTLADCREAAIPIGRAIAGSTAFVLGHEGEIFVGGDGLALGYLGDPELTARKFIDHPTHGRLYATGDLGRMREDGVIEFLGRRDGQIKLRGFRVEPGEVESALMNCEGVRQSIVFATDGGSGGKILTAAVVPAELDAGALRLQLAGTLPDHLVPAVIVAVDALPLTANGKVDTRALLREAGPAPPESVGANACSAITAIWTDLLGRAPTGVDVGFFDAGGDSLRLAQLVDRLAAISRRPISVIDLFSAPTIRSQAELISREPSARPAARRKFIRKVVNL